LIILYLFLLSINLLGHAFKLFGKDFAETLLTTTANPFLALFIGILATSTIQSSSTTTSIIVGLVAAGGLSLESAIPMVMGANIGTTVTNTLVSFGHATRRVEFRRAFSAAIVHDIFNIFSVAVLFPLEILFHPIQKTATLLEKGFEGIGGLTLFNPLKFIIKPAVGVVDGLLGDLSFAAVLMVVISLIILFLSLAQMVKISRSMVMGRVETLLDKYLFGNDLSSLLVGLGLTAVVQSSSVTTSIAVPLAGAGILSVRQIFPYTLGANIGTTVTALLAALATGNPAAVTVSFSHLTFNIFGIGIFYPLKVIPISLAEKIGDFGGKSRKNTIIVIVCFLSLYLVPILIFVLK
jgi:sodium-dependent phosphate cotransporter